VNILVDSPAWGDETLTFLKEYGGVDWLFLTHRDGISQVAAIQQTFGCRVLIQEQEAYLLPDATPTTFEQAFQITESCETIWTPGHSPGSACLYYDRFGGVLFSGRHLLPTPQGELLPQKTAKTFHWGRQIRSVQSLQKQFNPQTLQWICPGANTGFLRGSYAVGEAYEKLLKMATVPPQG
jgi:glyoxylase-like metal-dependent hydrolase (beta-lactamase superfamily II)